MTMPFENSAIWIQGILLGEAAEMAAVISLICIGYNMLQGTVPLRAGSKAIIGIFILFGSPLIAQGLLASVEDSRPVPRETAQVVPNIALPTLPPVPSPARTANPFDPYSDSSVSR